MRYAFTQQERIEDAIRQACASAWLTDSDREVSISPLGDVWVYPPARTPLDYFVIGRAVFVGGNDGVWVGAA